MLHPLLFEWSVSTVFGWGVYGLNVLRHWQGVAGTPAYCGTQIHLESLSGMDPLTLRGLAQKLVHSDQVYRHRSTLPNAPFNGVVLHSLGNHFSGSLWPSRGGSRGHITAGVIFFEDSHIPEAVLAARDYDVIVTGATWCEEMLRARGIENVQTVIQGVDTALFHPGPRAGDLGDRFLVFSGGKLEHRKGQDLVLLAFRAFAARHPEALLCTAWHSPWPAAALTVNRNPRIVPVGIGADQKVDVLAWAQANGIREDQVLDLGVVPNHLFARVAREMDVAVFPNRCEGGTNLVAMECMACGVPVIVADNSGQKDLVATGATYALTQQGPVIAEGIGTEGWGESDIDEIVAALEQVWSQREAARQRGLAGAEAMARWNWRHQIGELHKVLQAFEG